MIGGRCSGSAAADGGGLCPLHADRQPSFLMDPGKNLFYCYGCGPGGDVIRFAELYHQVRFAQALALLHQWRAGAPCCTKSRVSIACSYTVTPRRLLICTTEDSARPELIEHVHIGYAPGGCLRGWLTWLGYTLPNLSSRSGLRRGIRHLQASHRFSAGRQPLWPQSVSNGAAATGCCQGTGWAVFVGASSAISGSDSRRGSVRLRRA